MFKQYMILVDESFQYTAYTCENGSGYLHRSQSDYWAKHARGEMLWTVADDGNGVTLTSDQLKKKIRLDYSQVSELQILLGLLSKNSNLDSDILLFLLSNPSRI